MTNPNYSLITDTFNIFVYKQNTNNAYFKKNDIKGIFISSGLL